VGRTQAIRLNASDPPSLQSGLKKSHNRTALTRERRRAFPVSRSGLQLGWVKACQLERKRQGNTIVTFSRLS
jgi:hypothetical protein